MLAAALLPTLHCSSFALRQQQQQQNSVIRRERCLFAPHRNHLAPDPSHASDDMSADSFVVPIEEIVPSAGNVVVTPVPPKRRSAATAASCLLQRKPQQIFVVTTKASPTTTNHVKTVIINESFLKQEEPDYYQIQNGGVSQEEQSGAVASVMEEVVEEEEEVDSILPNQSEEEEEELETTECEEVELKEEVIYVEEGTTEEVVVDSGVGSDFFVGGQNAVIQLQEEEIIETPTAETEMSVAMELANLSQQGYEEYVNSDSENTTPPPPMDGPVSGEKPRLSYAQMIGEALLSREDRMLTLSEIYLAIHRRYPYFRMDVKSWQNAIRHNLTLNPSFTKVPRPNNEGRGNYWRMEDGAENLIFRRQIRNHHYNRAKNAAAGGTKTIIVQQHQVIQPPTTTTVVYPPSGSNGVVHLIQSPPQQQQSQVLQNIEQHQIVQQNGSIVFIALPSTSVKTSQASTC